MFLNSCILTGRPDFFCLEGQVGWKIPPIFFFLVSLSFLAITLEPIKISKIGKQPTIIEKCSSKIYQISVPRSLLYCSLLQLSAPTKLQRLTFSTVIFDHKLQSAAGGTNFQPQHSFELLIDWHNDAWSVETHSLLFNIESYSFNAAVR